MTSKTKILVSTKEPLKLADHSLGEFRQFLERYKNQLAFGNLRLTERYVNSEVKILVALSFVGCCGNIHNLTAEFQGNKRRFIKRDGPSFDNIHTPLIYSGNDRNQKSVLVDVVEFTEEPERVITSDMTLHVADEFSRLNADSIYYSALDGRCVLLKTIADRETRLSSRGSVICCNQLPHKMVQGTSKIVDGIPYEENDVCRHSPNVTDIKSRMLDCGYRVRLGPNSIGLRFTERANSDIQVVNVLFGPFNFGANSIKSGH